VSRRRALIYGRRGACPRPMFFHRRLHSGLGVGCLMRLSQSFFAMRLLQIWGGHGLFDDGSQCWIDGGSQWSLPVILRITSSKVFVVIFVFGRGLCVRWVGQLCMYPLMRICAHTCLCMFSLSRNTDMYYKKRTNLPCLASCICVGTS
jgi:hypothetical protein